MTAARRVATASTKNAASARLCCIQLRHLTLFGCSNEDSLCCDKSRRQVWKPEIKGAQAPTLSMQVLSCAC
ncbi:hypothetical protein PXO_00478 [Xanthomonas oryzae pv. oryzae PXO99A]|uniref:Uncharacterized protein n=1 Tax=Xanthomonas oryzae pv. oryzae (strain PXO99A) TaxID=360094 RepID=A0A0K0GJK6_XANOP|nr:hypothetical protein PXO_00478 [Xanthomonas oryzae pv. oryzae PXO99A]